MADSILYAFKDDGYRIGDCQVLLYDRTRVDVFPEGYLTKLYHLCKSSSRRSPTGILGQLFCGMTDLSHDALTSYLANLPVIVLVVWTSPNTFTEAGIAFPVLFQGKPPERMAFAGYGYFRAFWGTPEAEILGMLGLAYLFLEFGLKAIHGIRYEGNELTARFTSRFGFHETGRIPRYMLKDGMLVTGVVSSLLIEDFERYVARRIVELYAPNVMTNPS